MLDHVIDACWKAARYINRDKGRLGLHAETVILTPHNDPIAQDFKSRCRVRCGSESDVLSRYFEASIGFDYLVRITGDCPMIPPFIISKAIKTAAVNGYDYFSNVDEERSSIDGVDCEVISKRLIDWLNVHAKDLSDREHVTTLVRKNPPTWCLLGTSHGHFDLSDKKLSVDTPEDLERVRQEYDRINEKHRKSAQRYGKQAVHKY